jgi:hypothetical protein
MDAVVFFQRTIEVDHTLRWLEAHNEGRATADRLTLFQVLVAALQRTLHERPRANRFVKGGRIWQRDHVAITFAVKRRFDDRSRLVSTKVEFDALDDLDATVIRMRSAISDARGAQPKREQPTRQVGGWSLPVRALALRMVEALDRVGLLSRARVRSSPLHTSAMVSNLGSLGLDGALHHLYEQGTCSINATLGRVRREVVVRDDGRIETPLVAPMTFAIDERVADGFYFARSVDLLATYLQDPDRLRFQR